jgi:hypothetical protein
MLPMLGNVRYDITIHRYYISRGKNLANVRGTLLANRLGPNVNKTRPNASKMISLEKLWREKKKLEAEFLVGDTREGPAFRLTHWEKLSGRDWLARALMKTQNRKKRQ